MDRFVHNGYAMVLNLDGAWVKHTDAQAAIDAANERATEAQSRLALAVAEVRKWRDTNDAVEAAHDAGVKHNNKGEEYEAKNDLAYACLIAAHHARAATDADPVLKAMIEAKMIGGGE